MAKKNYAYGGKAAAILEWLNTEPNASNHHIAKHVGCSANYVHKLRKEMAHVQPEESEELTEEMAEFLHKVTQGKGRSKPEPAPSEIDAILDARANQYGNFLASANVAIRLKGTMHNAIAQQDLHMAPDQLLALDMIAVKISRILTGNPSHLDSWTDIAGYAKLVADRLQGVVR